MQHSVVILVQRVLYKGAVSFGMGIDVWIFFIGSKPRNDRMFSWFRKMMSARSRVGNVTKKTFLDNCTRIQKSHALVKVAIGE